MRISDLLAVGELGLRLLGGDPGREFDTVHITDLPDPGRYLSGGELVLSGLLWWHGPADSAAFVAALAAAGVSALGAGQAWLGHVPDDLVAACAGAGITLLEVPTEVSFRTLADLAARGPAGRLPGDVRDALGRHRRLVAAVAEGGGLPELFATTAAELGVTGAVLSATGRMIAGSADEPERLARAYLTAARLPCRAGRHTLFGVGRGPRAAGWVLACDGDLMDRADLGYELAACVTLERSRMEEGRRVERRLAGELVTAALADTDPAELNARLRTCGIDAAEPYAVVSATLSGSPQARGPAAPGPGVAPGGVGPGGVGPGTIGWGAAATSGPGGVGPGASATSGADLAAVGDLATVGGQVLEELLDREVVAAARADAAVALVPLRGQTVEDLARRLRRGAGTLAALPGTRLLAGLSGALTGAAALRGGIEEAGHARRLAEARADAASRPGSAGGVDGVTAAGRPASAGGAGGVTAAGGPGGAELVVTSDEIYTHALLLATVPGDVRRSFAGRTLEPLLDYDRRHQSDLVRTLATYLDCAGSWNTCAALLHVHVNTVRYRIRRVEELTGRDLSAMADRVDFFLALRAG
ncbi:helix-turn-helix domain-containing protein [Nonomuraea indica]|uniref:Helix-turn-helix domain-containing protein n=1 Tax=Nonomuraea indica TaxID=1581193 RepID=A0ABW8A757_9ACTN